MSTSQCSRSPSTLRSCTPGRSARSDRLGPARRSPTVRVRWRSSASVPLSTVRPAADDADPVAQRLDLGQDVAGQQHGPAGVPGLGARPPGRPPPSAGRARRSARPAAAARRRRRARRPARPSAGCPWSRPGPSCVGSSSNRSSSSSRRCGSSPPRSRPSRSMVSPPVSVGQSMTSPGTYASRRCSATASRQGSPPSSRDGAGVGPQQAEQDADGGRLARAVRAEEAVHLARTDGQVEPVERLGVPVPLGQAGHGDRIGHVFRRYACFTRL